MGSPQAYNDCYHPKIIWIHIWNHVIQFDRLWHATFFGVNSWQSIIRIIRFRMWTRNKMRVILA